MFSWKIGFLEHGLPDGHPSWLKYAHHTRGELNSDFKFTETIVIANKCVLHINEHAKEEQRKNLRSEDPTYCQRSTTFLTKVRRTVCYEENYNTCHLYLF